MNKTIKKELVLLKDLGMKFPTEKSVKKYRYGLYQCFCGKEFEAMSQNVKSCLTQSCGCLHRLHISKANTKHGLAKHRLYKTWTSMIDRCHNSNHNKYIYYGGRGIKVCNRWHNVTNFINDMYPAFKEGLTLDRIDNNKGYSPDNCRWATGSIQHRNTRKLGARNTTGYRGVSFNKYANKWASSITLNSKKIHLGYFNDKIEAAKAYDNYVVSNNLEHTLNFKKEE